MESKAERPPWQEWSKENTVARMHVAKFSKLAHHVVPSPVQTRAGCLPEQSSEKRGHVKR